MRNAHVRTGDNEAAIAYNAGENKWNIGRKVLESEIGDCPFMEIMDLGDLLKVSMVQ